MATIYLIHVFEAHRARIEVERLITHKLEKYEDWFKDKPEAFNEFQNALIQYRIEIYPNLHLREILDDIEKRMKAKGLVLK